MNKKAIHSKVKEPNLKNNSEHNKAILIGNSSFFKNNLMPKLFKILYMGKLLIVENKIWQRGTVLVYA